MQNYIKVSRLASGRNVARWCVLLLSKLTSSGICDDDSLRSKTLEYADWVGDSLNGIPFIEM